MLELVARHYGIPSMRSLVPASKGLLVNLGKEFTKSTVENILLEVKKGFIIVAL